jgi:7-cyano-7-deazaguanine synthase in queuosine biosynthesis
MQKMETKAMSNDKAQELSQRDWEQLKELGEALKKELTHTQNSITTNISSALANRFAEMNDWKTLEDLGESLKDDVAQAQNLILTSVHAAIAKNHRSASNVSLVSRRSFSTEMSDWKTLEDLGESLKDEVVQAQNLILTSVHAALAESHRSAASAPANISLSKPESDWKTLEDLGESLKEEVVQAQNLILTSVHAAIAKNHRNKGDALDELGESLRKQVSHAQESIRASVSTALSNLRNDDLFDGVLDKKETDKKVRTAREEVVSALKEDRARNIEKEMSDRKALEELGELFHEACDLANETIMTSVALALAQLDVDKINKEMRDWNTLQQLGDSLHEHAIQAQKVILDGISSSLATIHQDAILQAQRPQVKQPVRRRRVTSKENEGEERRRSTAVDKGLRRKGKNKENQTDRVNKESKIDGVKRQRTQRRASIDQVKSKNPAPEVSAKQIEIIPQEVPPEKLDQIRELASDAAKAAFKKDVEKAVRKDEAAIDALRKDVLKAALAEESI